MNDTADNSGCGEFVRAVKRTVKLYKYKDTI